MATLSARLDTLESQSKRTVMLDLAALTDDELLAYYKALDGYDLSLVPGTDFRERLKAVNDAAAGDLVLPPEARYAARGWLELINSC